MQSAKIAVMPVTSIFLQIRKVLIVKIMKSSYNLHKIISSYQRVNMLRLKILI